MPNYVFPDHEIAPRLMFSSPFFLIALSKTFSDLYLTFYYHHMPVKRAPSNEKRFF